MSELRKITLQFPSLRAFLAEYGERVSTEGMLLRGAVPPEVGSSVDIEVTVAEGMRLLRARGETLWSDSADSGRQSAAAVRFAELDAASRTVIAKIVEQRRREGAEVFDLEDVPGPREARLRDLTMPAAAEPTQPAGDDDAIFDLPGPAGDEPEVVDLFSAEPAPPVAAPPPPVAAPPPPVPLLADTVDAPFDLGAGEPAPMPILDPADEPGEGGALRSTADGDLSDLFGGDDPQMAPARGRTEAFPASFVDEVEAELGTAEPPSSGYLEVDTGELELQLGSSLDEEDLTLPALDLPPQIDLEPVAPAPTAPEAVGGAVEGQAGPPASEPAAPAVEAAAEREPGPATQPAAAPEVEPSAETPARWEMEEPAPPSRAETSAPAVAAAEVEPPVETPPAPREVEEPALPSPAEASAGPPPAAAGLEPPASQEIEEPASPEEASAAPAAAVSEVDRQDAAGAAPVDSSDDETPPAATDQDAPSRVASRVTEAFNAVHGPETVEIPIVKPPPPTPIEPPPVVDSPVLSPPPAPPTAAPIASMDDNLLSIPEFGGSPVTEAGVADPAAAAAPPPSAESVRGAASSSRHLGTWLLIALLVGALAVAGYFLQDMIRQETTPQKTLATAPRTAPPSASGAADPARPALGAEAPAEPAAPDGFNATAPLPTAAPDGAAPPAADTAPEPATPLTALSRITWSESETETALALIGNGALATDQVVLVPISGEQPRLVIKIAGVERAFQPAVLEVGTAHVERVRTGLQSNGELHVVVDLAAPGVVVLERSDRGSRVELRLGRG